MIQALRKLVTFEDFAAWRPEGGRYESYYEPRRDLTDFEDRQLQVQNYLFSPSSP